jgi:hypothetical protein
MSVSDNLRLIFKYLVYVMNDKQSKMKKIKPNTVDTGILCEKAPSMRRVKNHEHQSANLHYIFKLLLSIGIKAIFITSVVGTLSELLLQRLPLKIITPLKIKKIIP